MRQRVIHELPHKRGRRRRTDWRVVGWIVAVAALGLLMAVVL